MHEIFGGGKHFPWRKKSGVCLRLALRRRFTRLDYQTIFTKTRAMGEEYGVMEFRGYIAHYNH